MKPAIALISLLLVLLSGCGYRLQGRSDALPGGVRRVHIELFHNETYQPFLENAVTNEVVARFARHARLEIVEQPGRAEAVLSGRIIRFSNSALSYNQLDRIAEYRVTLAAEATLRRIDNGEVLWKGRVEWREDYAANSDKSVRDDLKEAATKTASGRLADELFSRMLDNF